MLLYIGQLVGDVFIAPWALIDLWSMTFDPKETHCPYRTDSVGFMSIQRSISRWCPYRVWAVGDFKAMEVSVPLVSDKMSASPPNREANDWQVITFMSVRVSRLLLFFLLIWRCLTVTGDRSCNAHIDTDLPAQFYNPLTDGGLVWVAG